MTTKIDQLVAALGPELRILRQTPLDDITRAGGELVGEAIRRLRAGNVTRISDDGEYGVIRLFEPGEVTRASSGVDALFDLPEPAPKPRAVATRAPAPRKPREKLPATSADRRRAVSARAVRADARPRYCRMLPGTGLL